MEIGSTKMLSTVSATFVILHLPMLMSFMVFTDTQSAPERLLRAIAYFAAAFQNRVNFFLYFAWAENYRHALLRVFCRCLNWIGGKPESMNEDHN